MLFFVVCIVFIFGSKNVLIESFIFSLVVILVDVVLLFNNYIFGK